MFGRGLSFFFCSFETIFFCQVFFFMCMYGDFEIFLRELLGGSSAEPELFCVKVGDDQKLPVSCRILST